MLAAAVIISCIFFFSINIVIDYLITLNIFLRTIISIILLAVISFFLGFPFPMAVRLLLKSPSEIAYGWAANGGTSVLISIFSIFVAMNTGISILYLCCAMSYLIAFLCILRFKS